MQTNELPSLHKRYLGALLGLACGDAVGTAVEFSPRGSFEPVTDMLGGGPFNLKVGQWTDDTSMALCLAESLINKKEFDAHDQMNRYLNWWRWGYLSSTGHCFDIGMTTRDALFDFERNQNPFSGSSDPETAGNGSLMRLAPIVLFGFYQKSLLPKLAADSSRTTHGAAEAIESCQLLAELMHGALSGVPKERLLDSIEQRFYQAKIQQLAGGAFRSKTYEQIKGSGYCIESLEAALWCFFHTDSYQAAVLKAVNLGDDADTTGAIVGQLAGAFYGVDAIPKHWRERLAMRDDIEEMATALFLLAQATKH